MPLIELNIRFPSHHQVIVKFGNEESETLDFKSPVTKKDLEDLRWYIEVYAAQYTGEPDDEEARRIEAKLIDLGEKLFKAVFTTPKAQDLYQQFQQQHTDKLLTIHSNEAEILALPWELLRESEHGFLSQQQPPVSIRRYCVQNHTPSFTVQAKPKLRLLFIVSRPNDESFLNPRLDPQAVMDALAEQGISQIETEFLRPATLKKLTERLNNPALPPVDIIHFDGHGRYDEKTKQGYLLFETPANPDNPCAIDDPTAGKKHEVSAVLLAKKLAAHHIPLVVLSACQSATVGNEPLGSVAAGLTDKAVPTVIAMVYSVLVQTTHQLFAAFYQALATGQGIAAALDHARLALANQNKRGTRRRGEGEFELTLQDWFVPALYQTNHDDALLLKDLRGFENLAGLGISNLPKLQTAGFFGRSRELWQIERWFVQGVERITLTGFGGQGKTYCAIEAAHWLLRTDLFDSVCFVDFSRYQGLDALRYAMNELGVLLDTTLPNDNAVPPVLEKRRLLWVWDNLESLAAETLDELLTVAVQWSAHSRFLFTTRQHRFTHADYAESNAKHQYLDLTGLAEQDALDYFNQLWQSEPLPEQPYPARYELMALFSKVAFHPLSIGLLAQQLKTRMIAELGERLEALLLCEPENSEDKSLLASLKLSLERLPPEQRELVKRLGVFQGGAFEDKLLEITDIKITEWEVLRSSLKRNGLIQSENLTSLDIKTSYIKFHPILAPTLWQELTFKQQEKLLDYYCQKYHQFSSFLYFDYGKKSPIIISTIARFELVNLLYAVNISLQKRKAYGVDFVNNINRFLYIFGLQHDRKILTEIIYKITNEMDLDKWIITQTNRGEQLFNVGKYSEAEIIFQEIYNNLNEDFTYERCVTLGWLGRCFNYQRKFQSSVSYYQQALTFTRSLKDTSQNKGLISMLFIGMADTLRDNGRYAQAEKLYEQALFIIKTIENIREEAVIQSQLGTLARLQCEFKKAVEYYKSSLDLFQRLDETTEQASCWLLLGITYDKSSQWKQAEEAYRKSAELSEIRGDLVNAAKAWNNLAGVFENQGNLSSAESWLRKAIKIKRGGDQFDYANSLSNLANLLMNSNFNLNEAQQLAEEALIICENMGTESTDIWKNYGLLAEIFDRQKNNKAEQYRKLSRDNYLHFSGMPNQMKSYKQIISIVLLVFAKPEYRVNLELIFKQLPNNSKNLVKAIRKVLNGEHNESVLLQPLNYSDAAIIHLILKGIANPESLESLFNS